MRDFIRQRLKRHAAYRRLFLGAAGRPTPDAEAVLADLIRFARIFEDQGPEPGALAMLEGRRQVLRRLWKTLNLNERDLLKLTGENND